MHTNLWKPLKGLSGSYYKRGLLWEVFIFQGVNQQQQAFIASLSKVLDTSHSRAHYGHLELSLLTRKNYASQEAAVCVAQTTTGSVLLVILTT